MPELKFEITKSSIERAKASRPAAITPGAISGSVTRRNVWSGVAPRSEAASSIERSKPINLDRTTTTTKLIENITWASSRVVKPSAMPETTNIESSAAPITISGVAIGRTISRLVAVRPRNW